MALGKKVVYVPFLKACIWKCILLYLEMYSEFWIANNHVKERNILKCLLSLLYKLIGTVVPTVSLL